MNDICAVSADLRAHIRATDEAERQSSHTLRRVAHYMETTCSPAQPEMVSEAMAEMSDGLAIFIAHHIGAAEIETMPLQQDRIYAQAMRQIVRAVKEYAKKEAERIAQREIAVASCPICYDTGCPTCRRFDD